MRTSNRSGLVFALVVMGLMMIINLVIMEGEKDMHIEVEYNGTTYIGENMVAKDQEEVLDALLHVEDKPLVLVGAGGNIVYYFPTEVVKQCVISTINTANTLPHKPAKQDPPVPLPGKGQVRVEAVLKINPDGQWNVVGYGGKDGVPEEAEEEIMANVNWNNDPGEYYFLTALVDIPKPAVVKEPPVVVTDVKKFDPTF